MNIIENHITSLIRDIITEIDSNNVDVVSLCETLSLTPAEFIDLINNPVKNVSLYIEILEEVRNERD